MSSSYIDIPIKKPSQMLVMRREIVLRRISGGLRPGVMRPGQAGSQCLVGPIDRVMYDFPEVFVTRHGCEPWEDLALKLMQKWPELYYSTSAFAPKHYPEAIIRYANTRGATRSSVRDPRAGSSTTSLALPPVL